MKEIYSSMAGTVFQVIAGEGDTVSKGQTVLVLESMKMEIPVDSEHDGTLKEIKVAVGDFVNEGDILAVLA
ncbi:acetyl-CoA carboxylase biotin carboxyl carrier protein subunit [Jeotgalibacillus proteolyticus]|uniref:acetyl-CoA carboxylase biotin carboxyl carrier protein subunit n=1 Tax=Jeotgalibacillus proteolyticus TaxID=2082395 RepID=UPI003CE87A91